MTNSLTTETNFNNLSVLKSLKYPATVVLDRNLPKPLKCLFPITKLTCVTGEIVADGRIVWKFVCHRQQNSVCFFGAFQFVQTVSPMNVTPRIVRQHHSHSPRHFRRHFPFIRLVINAPAHLQDKRMRPHFRRDQFQLLIGFQPVAKLKPAFGCFQLTLVIQTKFHFEGSLAGFVFPSIRFLTIVQLLSP
jgi:hypothetical protein